MKEQIIRNRRAHNKGPAHWPNAPEDIADSGVIVGQDSQGEDNDRDVWAWVERGTCMKCGANNAPVLIVDCSTEVNAADYRWICESCIKRGFQLFRKHIK